MKGRADDWTRIVQSNWRKLTAYIVSSAHPSCVKMALEEVSEINRVMRHVTLADVQAVRPPRHWFMAVIVCPGDDLTGLAAWAARHDARRIHFYLHRDADVKCLETWRDTGLPLTRVEEERFASYGRMHKKLGLDLSDQVYADFCP